MLKLFDLCVDKVSNIMIDVQNNKETIDLIGQVHMFKVRLMCQ